MEINCEIPRLQLNINKFYDRNNHKNTSTYEMIKERNIRLSNNKEKTFNILSVVMKANNHYLELFKSKNFPAAYGQAENAIKIFFGWSVGVNVKELSDYLDVNEDIAKHFYLLSTLYAKRYIKSHLDEWKVGGSEIVVLVDVYPDGCNKFNYLTPNEHCSVLCIAEIKDIPTKYWFQILNQTEPDKSNIEILDAVRTMVRPGSTLVIDLESTALTEETCYKIKHFYKVVASLESLKKHDTENNSLLKNLETIWKPALDICEFANYHSDTASYFTSYLWNQRFGNDNLKALLNQF